MTETEDHYPSPREALFGNGHIANLRCAVKYFVWQGSYLLLALVGTFALVLATIWDYLKRAGGAVASRVPTGRDGDAVVRAGAPIGRGVVRVGDAISAAVTDARVKKAARGVTAALLLGASVAVVGFVVWAFVFHTLYALATVGGATLVLLAAAGIIYTVEETSAPDAAGATIQRAGSKAKETPGVRRVYGNCPVHMDLEPKWFEGLAARFD